MTVPLSEEEQRILQEMERRLREHDRAFVERVSHGSSRLQPSGPLRWAVVGFLAGTVLLVGTFRTSLALGICGVLIMLVSALAFAQHVGATTKASRSAGATGVPPASGEAAPVPEPPAPTPERATRRKARSSSIAEEWSEMRRRMRSRFGHRD